MLNSVKLFKESAALLAEERLVELLVPEKKKTGGMQNPFEMLFGQKAEQDEPDYSEVAEVKRKRSDIAARLKAGELEEEYGHC